MGNKGDRPSKIPAGTFASSLPPPPPPEAIAASLRPHPQPHSEAELLDERKRFTRTLVDGAGASSRASVPPPVPEDARRQPTTLVGHTTSAAPPALPPAAVLSPPKWQGAKAYLEGREPKPRVSSIPNVPAITSGANAHASAIPSKVTTKLGNPTVQAAARSAQSFERAVERAVDEAVSEPAPRAQASDPLEDIPVEELSSDELNELRASDPPPAARPEAEPASSPHFVMPDVASTFVGAAPEPMRELPVLPPLLVHAAPASSEPALPVATAREREPEPVRASTAAAAAARSAPTPARPRRPTPAEPPSSVAGSAFASSLAPAETPARRDSSQRLGVLLLAAITLLSAGGWALTRGGFRRAGHVAAATAPAAPPAAPVVVPATVPPLGDPAPAAAPIPSAVPAAQPAPPAATVAPAAPVAPAEAAPSEPPSHPVARPAIARRSPPTPPLQPPTSVTPQPEAPAPAPAAPVVEANAGPLPPTPTRQDVVAALEPLRAGVQQCAGNLRGIAQLDVTVASNGSVTHAVVAGDFAGTPEGSCIARIARSAKFSPFERPRFRVIYPYAL